MTKPATEGTQKHDVLEQRAIPLALGECGLSLALGFITLGSKGLWQDELYSATVASGSWRSMYQSWRQWDANMSLYDIVLHLWRAIGTSDATLRGLSVLAAAVSVFVVFAIGRRLFGAVIGLVAGLFMAVAPFAIQHSQEVRSYSLTVLLVSLASYFFVRAIERPSWLPWAGYALVASLAVYAHFFAGLVILAHAISLLFLDRRPWRYVIGSWSAILVLTAPGVFLAATGREDQLWWLAVPGLHTIVGQPVHLVGGIAPAVVFAGLLVVTARVAHARWRESGVSLEMWRVAFLLSWAVIPPVLAILYSWVVSPLYLDRFLLVSLPAVILGVAVGVVHLPTRLSTVACALVVVLSIASTVNWYRQPSAEGWREAGSLTTSAAHQGDGVVFCGKRQPFEYYLLQEPTATTTLTPLYPSEPWKEGFHGERYPRLSADSRWPDRVWIVEQYFGSAPPAQGLSACKDFQRALAGYTLARARVFAGVRVQLYERGI
jgi:mannosyltransferase